MVSILKPARKKPKPKPSQGMVKGLLPTVEPTIKSGYINETIPESAEVVEKYWIKEPFSGVVIAKLPESGGSLEYFVQEVTLTELEQNILDKIIEVVSVEINPSALEKQEDVKIALLDEAKRIMAKYVKKFPILMDEHVREKVYYYLERDLLGYGPIHTLMNDWRIEDISCDGVNSNIYIWHRRYESVPTSIKFTDRKALDDFIVKLAHKSGKHVSSAFPIVDAMIFGKHRLAASFREEISPKGSTFTIRKFREEPYSIIDLMNLNTVSDSIAAYLWLMMENRASILVIGGTAAGKTTILNAIAGLIKPGYKVVTVEETAEINIPTENWVQFTSRESYGLSGNKVGEVSLFDLVRTSLRYRPDFLIVGEVRGEEAFVLFQAVASVTGDTPILIRERGDVKLVKIAELVDKYYREGEERVAKFTDGVDVLTLGTSNEVTFRPISYVLRHSASEVYNIRYTGGSTRATGNHSVFVLADDGSIREKPVSELTTSDLLVSFCDSQIERTSKVLDAEKLLATSTRKLLVSQDTMGNNYVSYSRSFPVPAKIPVDEEFAFTLGAYLADGCVKYGRSRDGRVVFSFGEPEKKFFAERVGRFFRGLGSSASVDERGTYSLYEYNHTPAAVLFEKLSGRNPKSKQVPSALFEAPKSVVRSFLDGYKADSRRTQVSHRNFTVYSSAKDELINAVSWLARLNGRTSFISERNSKYRSVYVWDGPDDPKQWVPINPLRELRRLLNPASMPRKITYVFNRHQTVISKQVASRVLEWILSKRRNQIGSEAQRIIDNYNALLSSSLIASKVQSITKEEYNDFVYDVSVPNSEAFFGGESPILLHNTGHGGLCTIHGESLDTAVKRLTSPPMNVAESYIPLMNVAIMLERVVLPKTVAGVPFGRRTTNVWEIEDFSKYVSVFEWSPTEDIFYDYTRRSVMLHRFAYRTGRSFTDMLEEIERRRALLKYLQVNNIRQVREVYKYITEYYVDREAQFKRLGIKVEELSQAEKPEAPVVRVQEDVVQPAEPPRLTALPTEPIKVLQSGSYQILGTLFEARGPVDEETLMQSVGLGKVEFDSLLAMLLKVGHAAIEEKGDGVNSKKYIMITPDGTRAYSLISKNVAESQGKNRPQKVSRPK